jgi:hypothetical protein
VFSGLDVDGAHGSVSVGERSHHRITSLTVASPPLW